MLQVEAAQQMNVIPFETKDLFTELKWLDTPVFHHRELLRTSKEAKNEQFV